MDAKVTSEEADVQESDALSAIDFAARSLDNARLLILDAIDGRAYADAQGVGALAPPGNTPKMCHNAPAGCKGVCDDQ
jgi:hypothetical protein